MQAAASTSEPADPDSRLAAQAARLRWVALHCASRALLRRLELDDLVQEALLRAWTAREHWPPWEPGEAGLARWLAVVVRRSATDAARASRAAKRAGRETRLELADFSSSGARARELAAASAGPATRASAGETRLELEQAFLRLSGEHRRVLALRQFAGLSAAEAAQRMGRSESALHSLFRRALQAWEREGRSAFPISHDENAAGPRSDKP